MEAIIQDKEKYIKSTLKCFPKLNWEEVDDMFSEALFRICKRKNPIPVHSGYVYTVMKHLAIDKHICRKAIQTVDADVSVIYNDVPEQLTSPGITYRDIRPLIYQMKDNYKRYMILKFGFKMKQTEIAKFLDISRGTVAPMIMRGTQKLKQAV